MLHELDLSIEHLFECRLRQFANSWSSFFHPDLWYRSFKRIVGANIVPKTSQPRRLLPLGKYKLLQRLARTWLELHLAVIFR